MKNRILLSASLLAAMVPASTFAQDPPPEGIYVNGQAGFAFLPSTGFRGRNLQYWNNFTSYNFDAGIGYKSGPLRYEAQFNYIKGRQKKLAGVNVGGYTTVYNLMANLYFDFDMWTFYDVVPYLGGGIGWSNLSASGVNNFASANAFAYQGMGGLRYAVDDNITLDLGYRYLGNTSSGNFTTNWGANLVNLGITFNFG